MADLVTISACVESLRARGDKISRQGLTKYCDEHGLVEKREGRRVYVDPDRVAARRQDYQREKMRGLHVVDTPTAPPDPAPADPAAPPALETIREAKARRETAAADKAELEMAERRRDVVSTAEMELLVSRSLSLMTEALLGGAIVTDAQRLATALSLPDERVPALKAELKATRRAALSRVADLARDDLARLDPDHADGLPERIRLAGQLLQAERDELRARHAGRLRA